MRQLLVESWKYALASAAAFAVDLTILTFLVRMAHWNYLLAAAFAFTAAGSVLYAICVKYVFRFRRISNKAIEWPSFVALGLVGLAVNVAVIYFAVETLTLALVPAKVLASGCTFGINFLLRRLMLFSNAPLPNRP